MMVCHREMAELKEESLQAPQVGTVNFQTESTRWAGTPSHFLSWPSKNSSTATSTTKPSTVPGTSGRKSVRAPAYLQPDALNLAVRDRDMLRLTHCGAWAWTPTSLSLPFLLWKWDDNNVSVKCNYFCTAAAMGPGQRGPVL